MPQALANASRAAHERNKGKRVLMGFLASLEQSTEIICSSLK
jgi:hypothetical protein